MDDVVAVAEESDLQVLALDACPIAPRRWISSFRSKALGNASHQIGDQRPRGPPQGGGPAWFRYADRPGSRRPRPWLRRRHAARVARPPLGPFTLTGLTVDIGGDPRRNGDPLFFPTRDIVQFRLALVPLASIQVWHSPYRTPCREISPPTLASRASWSAITPLGVDRMATPRPLLTRGKALDEA